MYSDQDLFLGAAFTDIFRETGSVTVIHAHQIHPSAYRMESGGRKIAVLFKVNRVRKKSPWQFTFTAAENSALAQFRLDHPEHSRFVVLICRLDGACCLSEEQLLSVTGGELDNRAVSVKRPREGSYHVSGPDGRKLKGTIPMKAWASASCRIKSPKRRILTKVMS